jgi:hypothetical protein
MVGRTKLPIFIWRKRNDEGAAFLMHTRLEMRLKGKKYNDNMELICFNIALSKLYGMDPLSCKIFRESELHYGW